MQSIRCPWYSPEDDRRRHKSQQCPTSPSSLGGRQHEVHTNNDEHSTGPVYHVYLCTGMWSQALLTYQDLLEFIISERSRKDAKDQQSPRTKHIRPLNSHYSRSARKPPFQASANSLCTASARALLVSSSRRESAVPNAACACLYAGKEKLRCKENLVKDAASAGEKRKANLPCWSRHQCA